MSISVNTKSDFFQKTILIFIFLCFPSTVLYKAFGFSLPDSLHVQTWTGAQISDQKPSGLKSIASGIIDAWLTHNFSDKLFYRVYLDATPSFPTSLIEEAALGYHNAGFTVKGGMLSNHIGRASIYKPFSIFNQFTRTSVVWDSYGFGASVDGKMGGMTLGGSALLNLQETGSAHILWTIVNKAAVSDRMLIGIQTAELETQDNDLILGNDLNISFNFLKFHIAGKYCAYQGYGNITMKPGYLTELLGEAGLTVNPRFTLNCMAYYKEFNKSYSFRLIRTGIDSQFLLLTWLGLYGGYEYQKSMNTVSRVPQAGISIIPVARRTLIRIGEETTITGTGRLPRASAILWFEL